MSVKKTRSRGGSSRTTRRSLLCIARDGDVRLRDVAERVGITERQRSESSPTSWRPASSSARRSAAETTTRSTAARRCADPAQVNQEIGELLDLLGSTEPGSRSCRRQVAGRGRLRVAGLRPLSVRLDDGVHRDDLLDEQIVLAFLDIFSSAGRSWPGTTKKTVGRERACSYSSFFSEIVSMQEVSLHSHRYSVSSLHGTASPMSSRRSLTRGKDLVLARRSSERVTVRSDLPLFHPIPRRTPRPLRPEERSAPTDECLVATLLPAAACFDAGGFEATTRGETFATKGGRPSSHLEGRNGTRLSRSSSQPIAKEADPRSDGPS